MTTTTQKRSIVHTPGSPSNLKGSHKPASNPDGKTPVDLPSKPKSLHDQKPPALAQDDATDHVETPSVEHRH